MEISPRIELHLTRNIVPLIVGVALITSGCHHIQRSPVVPPPLPVPADAVLPTEVSDTNGLAVGNTAGTLQVSSDGDLTYDFPLWVPPGRNGVQPELSLAYRGRGSNGLLGVGWSIGGLSQITRCAQTTAQNGANAPIAFDASDRFCLDGQRLVAIKGDYGADNSEYRTERDMFAKIISGGADSQGPGWFKVFLKNGRILSYGTTQNSRIEGQRFHSYPSLLGGAPQSQTGAVTSWISPDDNLQHVAYIGGDGHVYEAHWGPNQAWNFDDATAASGAPTAQAGALTSWVSISDKLEHIAYIGGDSHVYELYSHADDAGWQFDDVTKAAKTPANAYGGALTSWVYGTLQHIAYIAGNNHVYQYGGLIGARGNWRLGDLTEDSGAPANAYGGALTSWISGDDGRQHIAYIGGNNHVYDLHVQPGRGPWKFEDVTSAANARANAAPGALTSWISSADNFQHIAYIGCFACGLLPNYGVYEFHAQPSAGAATWDFEGFIEGSAALTTDLSQTVRLTWALARAEDRYGNGINYGYARRQTSNPSGEPEYEFLPSVITYTDTADKSWPALKSVEFHYEQRPDVRTFYVSGLRMTLAHRLVRIYVQGPSESPFVRIYKLAYRNDSVTQRSLLTNITECDGLNVCKAPLSFDWEPGSMTFFDIDTGVHDDSSINKNTQSDGKRFLRLASSDVNADGVDDLMFFVEANAHTSAGWYYRTNLGYKSVMLLGAPSVFDASKPATQIRLPHDVGPDDVRFVDMDRDGRADLILTQLRSVEGIQRKDVDVVMSPAEPFSAPAFHQTLFGGEFNPLNHNSYVADLDGNGFPDLVLPEQYNLMSYSLNSGPPMGFGGVEPLPKGSGARANTFTTDIDADGTTEIMLRNVLPPAPGCFVICEPHPGIWYGATKISGGSVARKDVGLIDGSVFPAMTVCYDVFSYPCFIDQFVDLNRDGLPDVISINSDKGGNPWISINTGNGFHDRAEIHLASAVDGPSGQFPPYRVSRAFVNPGILVGNLNSDGQQDFIFVGGQNGNTHPVALLGGGDGVSFQVPFYLKDQNGKYLPLPDTPYLATLADVNGDGIPDLLEVVNGELHVYLHLERLPDVIKRVVEGTKEDYTISWAPISDPDVHQRTQTANCSFPTMCQNRSVWVVADVARFDGAGGTRHLNYQYQDARADGLGRGWLGFAQKQETDSATGIVAVTTYDNFTRKGSAYPFAGLPRTEGFTVTLDNGHVFSQQRTTDYQYTFLYGSPNGPPVYSVQPQQFSEKEFESPVSTASAPQRQVTTTYTYDGFGNPTHVLSINGDRYTTAITTNYENRTDNWLITLPSEIFERQITPNGESIARTSVYGYDRKTGAVTTETVEPSGDASLKLSRRILRDRTGLVTTVQESFANQRRMTKVYYDPNENTWPTYILDPLLHGKQYVYHPSFGILVGLQDENNNYTRWQVDGFGRLRAERPPDGGDMTVSYATRSPGGESYTITARKVGGQEIVSMIDRLGREWVHLHRGFNGRQIVVNKLYDSAGRLAQISNPFYAGDISSGDTSISYDALGRIRNITNPDGSAVEQNYSGLTTLLRDENQNLKTVFEDQLHRPVIVKEQVDDNHEIETRYAYGPFGVLESVTDPLGNVTRAEYDVRGRRTVLSDVDSGTRITFWDAADEQTAEINSLGSHFKYKRDALGRPVKIRSKEGITNIVWDQAPHGIGKIAAATSTDGIRTLFSYDSVSRLSSQELRAGGQNFAFVYTFDSSGRLATLQYPIAAGTFGQPQFMVSFEYTDYGAIRAVKNVSGPLAAGKLWENTARNAFDEITGEAFGNGVTTSRQFDVRGRPRFLKTTGGAGLQDLAYQYYANGNLQSRTDNLTGITERYCYDKLSRLTKWNVDKNNNRDLSQEFKYDDIGNVRLRTTIYGNGDNLVYSYSRIGAGPHAVTSVNNAAFSYDAAGRESSAPGRRTIYRSWGLPKSIESRTRRDDFKYDFQHQRIFKLSSDGVNKATIGGLFERITHGKAPGTETYYIRAGDRALAAMECDKSSKQCSLRYLHDDRLSSVAAISDEAGRMVQPQTYDPFGTSRKPSDPAISVAPSSSLGFTEREADQEVDLLNMLGRLYDPKIARFTTPDPLITAPLSSQGLNGYSYALNNPLRWTDPTGLQALDLGWEMPDFNYELAYTWYDPATNTRGEAFAPVGPLTPLAPGISDDNAMTGDPTGGVSPLQPLPSANGAAESQTIPQLKAAGPEALYFNPLVRAPDGSFVNYKQMQKYQALAAELETGTNIASGLLGAVGYLIGGPKGAALGANVGAFGLGIPGLANSMAASQSAVDSLNYSRYALSQRGELLAPNTFGVPTPQGLALQQWTPEALNANSAAQQGAFLYRQGQFTVQNTGNAQFWSFSNPLITPGYAMSSGMAATQRIDWLMRGTVPLNQPFVTRPSPSLGLNPGGAMEAVSLPNGVRIDWFVMP